MLSQHGISRVRQPLQAARLPDREGLPTAAIGRGATAITVELRNAILAREYGYGEKLPTERQLASLFKVSRTTVRRAILHLEEERMVVRRVGSGTFVSYRPTTSQYEITETTSPLELIEVRLAVEPHMTRLAVVNATARDFDCLEEALVRTEAPGTDAEHFSRWDEEFHLRLAECTHNLLLGWIYQQINDVRGHSQWNARKAKILTAKRINEYNRQHRDLYEALRSRDVEKAVETIVEHLQNARSDLLGIESD